MRVGWKNLGRLYHRFFFLNLLYECYHVQVRFFQQWTHEINLLFLRVRKPVLLKVGMKFVVDKGTGMTAMSFHYLLCWNLKDWNAVKRPVHPIRHQRISMFSQFVDRNRMLQNRSDILDRYIQILGISHYTIRQICRIPDSFEHRLRRDIAGELRLGFAKWVNVNPCTIPRLVTGGRNGMGHAGYL